jgi:DNA helicase-4
MISKVFNPSRDLELIMTFLKHVKTNNLSVENIEQKLTQHPEPERAKAFMLVFTPIYKAYQTHLENNREIDFEDLVHRACDYIDSKRYQSPYKYLMVDEYQDASQDRIRLVKGLLAQHSQAKLFAVGDDWQSIYRFAGADLKVMTGFEEIFGFTKQLQLTKTFRCVQEIADVAATFVQKNPEQFEKSVKALHSSPKPPVVLRPYAPDNPDKILFDILKAIQKRATEEDKKVSVYILTRYIRQKPQNLKVLQSKFANVHLEWKTVHASKGLEADYVIVHHLNGGSLGFPSEISDDPLLCLVIPKPEKFTNAEERRLLYVALTRAKKGVFCFYHPENPSSFIKELSEIDGVKTHDKRYEPVVHSGDKCPKCKNGKMQLRTGKNGIFLGCSAYPNCDYTTSMKCPECKIGNIVTRTARNTGKQFHACDQFPKCKYVREPKRY